MIESLHIENIAVIRSLDVDLSDGFTILTGETGAGKSIIIDSIQLLLGGKADKDLIRNGEKSALVAATFTGLSGELTDRLVALGLVPEEEREELDSVMIQRTLSIDGRSTVRFCGRPITLQMLRGFLHCGNIQLFRHHRHILSFKDTGGVGIPDAVCIGLFLRVQPGVEPLGAVLAGIYADILRQIPPQIFQNLRSRHPAFAVKVCHLALCMDAGIGTPTAGNLNGFAQNFG